MAGDQLRRILVKLLVPAGAFALKTNKAAPALRHPAGARRSIALVPTRSKQSTDTFRGLLSESSLAPVAEDRNESPRDYR